MADDPLERPSEDPRDKYFGHQQFVEATADVMRRARPQSASNTFALIGPWGSGKTTIINALVENLASGDAAWRVTRFNPWFYSDTSSLTWGFFTALREAVPAGDKWTDLPGLLDKLQVAVSPIAKVASLFGVPDMSGAAKDLLSSARLNPVKVRDDIAAKLETMIEPMLVILDDLDRLTAAELLETFKLVRFIGRLPNVYYLLCYDERTLTDMLNKTDLVGESGSRRALEYLEKIVQVRFDIPPLRPDHVEELFYNSVLDQVRLNAIRTEEDQALRLQIALTASFTRRLATPRAVKHLLAQLEAFLPSVRDEVDWVDFTLLSWIRCFEPALYAEIPHRRDFLLGTLDRSTSSGSEEFSTQLSGLYDAADVAAPDRAGVTDVLLLLFPNLDSSRRVTKAASGRIGDIDYFDRFFAFGVPTDDLHNSAVADAYDRFPEDASPNAELVRVELIANPRRTASKILAELSRDPSNAAGLAEWLVGNAGRFPNTNSWFSSAGQAELLLSRALAETDEAQRDALTRQALAAGLPAVFLLLRGAEGLLRVQTGSQEAIAAANSAGTYLVEMLSPHISDVLDTASRGDVFEDPEEVFMTVTTWERVSPGAARGYVAHRIADGSWTEFDVLARLVGSSRPIDTEDRVGWLEPLDVDFAGKFLDVEHAFASMPDTTPPPLTDPPHGHSTRATPENRRAYLNRYSKMRSIRSAGANPADPADKGH